MQKYKLSGFVRCAHCGRSMTGQMNDKSNAYYRHNCTGGPLRAVRVDQFEPAILDYLYGKLLDEPSFNRAVETALPPAGQRESLISQQSQTKQQSINTQAEINRLVDAIAKGVDAELLLTKQVELKATVKALKQRFDELEIEIAQFPDAAAVKTAAMLVRVRLIQEHTQKDWRDLSYEDVQQFLIHLFGQRKRNAQNGIFVSKDERGRLVVDFKGQVQIERAIVGGKKALPKWRFDNVHAANANLQRRYDLGIRKAKHGHRRRQAEADAALMAADSELRPVPDNK